MGIELSAAQSAALVSMLLWYRSDDQQVFTLAGLAGTGKTTVVGALRSALSLDAGEVSYMAYTGKAAMVMKRKGVPARTIHSQLYKPEERVVKKEKIVNGEKRVFHELETVWTRVPCLSSDLKLIVVDEASMVPWKMMKDLLAMKKKVLLVGDHGQLPPVETDAEPAGPVRGPGDLSGYDYLKDADVFLEEIHRQSEGNPILLLAMKARNGQKIDYGSYPGGALVIPKSGGIPERILTAAHMMIAGTNATRVALNASAREARGMTSPLPMAGDKLICVRNDWKIASADLTQPLVNGLVGYCHTDTERTVHRVGKAPYFLMDFSPEWAPERNGEGFFSGLKVALARFEDTPEGAAVKVHAQFEYGYCLTCHKAQGSEQPKVFVWNEPIGRTESDRRAWLYTAITRASKAVVLAL